jgi:hypothetical protein
VRRQFWPKRSTVARLLRPWSIGEPRPFWPAARHEPAAERGRGYGRDGTAVMADEVRLKHGRPRVPGTCAWLRWRAWLRTSTRLQPHRMERCLDPQEHRPATRIDDASPGTAPICRTGPLPWSDRPACSATWTVTCARCGDARGDTVLKKERVVSDTASAPSIQDFINHVLYADDTNDADLRAVREAARELAAANGRREQLARQLWSRTPTPAPPPIGLDLRSVRSGPGCLCTSRGRRRGDTVRGMCAPVPHGQR